MTSLPSTLADTLSSTTTSTSMGIPSSSNGTLVTLPPTLPPISSGPLLPQPERLTGLQTLVSFVPHTQRNDEPPPVSTSVSPPQPPSTPPAHPSQTRGNKKKQKLPPITNEQARINFLETELNAAQSRIVILDKSIVDKDQELSVCWARIKILEEKQNQDILDKYSLNSSTIPRKCSPVPSSPRAPPTCSHFPPAAPCCLHSPPPPCSAYRCCSQHNRTEPDDLKRNIVEIRRELNNIRIKINENKTSKEGEPYDNSYATTAPEPTQQEQNNDDVSTLEVLNESQTNLNESLASVEEFMPDVENQNVNMSLNF